MGLFDQQLQELHNLIRTIHKPVLIPADPGLVQTWPKGNGRDVILSSETALELGCPQHESISFLLWTDDPKQVEDKLISLIGPDFEDCAAPSISFGKIAVVCAHGFDEQNAYDRYRELESVRFRLDLKGYMIRAASQHQREWSRLSQQALSNGFSVKILGSALIQAYHTLPYVDAAQVYVFTQTANPINQLRPIAQQTHRRIGALNKKLHELTSDCDECEYNDICEEILSLNQANHVQPCQRVKIHPDSRDILIGWGSSAMAAN